MNTGHSLSIAGAATFWNVAASSDRRKIEEGLVELGHADLCPGERTPFAAAKRAASLLYSGAKYHIGNLKDRAGVSIERVVHKDDTENEYPQVGYITVNEDSRTCSVTINDPSLSWQSKISAETCLQHEYERQLTQCAATSIGIALTKACEKFAGTRLRKNGGVYFIPSFTADEFAAVAKVFEGAATEGSTYVEQLTVAKSDETLRGVTNSLRANIADRVKEIKQELVDGLGKRGVQNREKELKQLVDQAASYETLLGESLSDIQDELKTARRELRRNQFAVSAEREREANAVLTEQSA